MKTKILFIFLSSLNLFCSTAFADNGYYSSTTQSASPAHGQTGANGYSSTVTNPNAASQGFSFSVTLPTNNSNAAYIAVRQAPHRYNGPHWINTNSQNPLPQTIVIGGREHGDMLYLCRGSYAGGMHPGKIVNRMCHISYGGKEIELSRYQVLVSKRRLEWVQASNGFVPKHAIAGGFEAKRQLYICQVAFNGGFHPGKIVGNACNIAWGGKEFTIPQYSVLVG